MKPSIFEICDDDQLPPLSLLEDCIRSSGLVVMSGVSLHPNELLKFAQQFGELEPAWEDEHPEYEFLQLMDSDTKVQTQQKSSSRYWHTDRSFVSRPSWLTLLYAELVVGKTTPTEFIDARSLASTVIEENSINPEETYATHSFAKVFPSVMIEKGQSEEKVSKQIALYPDVQHPFFTHDINGVPSIYFNELCVTELHGPGISDSDKAIGSVLDAIRRSESYVHSWNSGDLLIWDNFRVVHRASMQPTTGRRRYIRSTVGTKP